MAWTTSLDGLAKPIVAARTRRKRRSARGAGVIVVHPRLVFVPLIQTPGARSNRSKRQRVARASGVATAAGRLHRYLVDTRGLYRVFNAAEYRFYRSNVGPPVESDTPFATSSTLPNEPTDLYADGTWWISVSYFNGVIDSGFLPLGDDGQTYVRLDLATGAEVGVPPNGPTSWRLSLSAAGVVTVVGFYFQAGALRADDWAITFTADGSTPGTPPAVAPDATVVIAARGLSILSYDLPAQAQGATVKVRLQTRRQDATLIYSEGSTVLSAVSDVLGSVAQGDDESLGIADWPGRIPEDV